jgi:hypothetical protein
MAQGISAIRYIALFPDIWESKPNDTCIPTSYGLNSVCRPLKASWSLNFERFTPGRLSHFYRFVNSRKCQTLIVPRQSRGFTRMKLSIWHYLPKNRISGELAVISEILEGHPEILEGVYRDLSRAHRVDTGRDGMTAEQVLRCAVLKQYRRRESPMPARSSPQATSLSLPGKGAPPLQNR